MCVFLVLALATLTASRSAAQGVLTNGLAQDGTISAPAQTASWTISATRGDRIVVQIAKLTGGAAFTPSIEILFPDGLSLGIKSGGTAARLDVQAEFTGTYTINFSDANGTGTGMYRLRLAQVPLAFIVPPGDEGGPLTNGISHQGTIDLGDLDLWTLSAGAGDRIVLLISKVTGGASFTPMIELFGPDGSRIGADNGVVAARLDAQAPVAGTYTVLVSDALQTGSGTYQLQLAQVPGAFVVPAGDEGGPLADGVDQDGTIQLGDLDLWTFSAAPGDLINLQITELTGGASFTPMIELFTPDGQRRGAPQGGSGAALERVIETGGTYTVLVSDATQTGSGTYRLHLTRSTIAPLGANVLTNGGTVDGSIAAAGQTNSWTFPASVGDTLIVRIGKASGTTFVPWIRLFTPSSTQVGSASSSAGAEIAVTATNSGTFKVVVGDNSSGHNQTGSYRLTLANPGSPVVVSAGDEGGPMTNGVMHTGNIDVGDMDVWSFTANQGESLAVRMGELVSGSSLTPYLRLFGPDGSLLSFFGTSGAASEVSVRATNSGTFTVVATDNSAACGGSGTYRLKLGKTGSPIVVLPTDEGGPMTNGVMQTGTIDVGDLDVWSFTANAGDNLVVRMGELVNGSSLPPYLRLLGPDGALLGSVGSSPAAAEVSLRATNSGTFTVIATDNSAAYAGSGTYRLKLGKTGSPIVILPTDEGGPMTNGMMHAGTIDVGDLDVWSFAANAGDSLVVRMGELVSNSPLTPYLRLFGPDGSLLSVFGSSPVAAEASARATNSGTFTVIATDNSAAYGGSGTYRLKLGKTGSPIVVLPTDEGGPMTNGVMHTGTIDVGDMDVWSFAANAGDNLVVRMGELVSGSSLTPYLRLFGPAGSLLSVFGSSSAASEVSTRATNSGTFTVIATDNSAAYGGSGTYRLKLGKTGSPVVVLPTDEGGPMTNGFMHTGNIDVGDMDVWSFSADAGDSLVVRMGELVSGSPLTPYLRLFGPDGSLLSVFGSSSVASEVSTRATNSGTFIVIATDNSAAYGGSGTYRLTLVRTGNPLFVSAGDEGGSFTGAPSYDGTLDSGDLDAWTFTAWAGDSVSLRVDELVGGSSLTPWIRLYGYDGTLLNTVSGATTAQISRTAPGNGTYTVVLADQSSAYGGSGTYRLTVNGLTDGFKVRMLRAAGGTPQLVAIGGVPDTSFVLLSTTNLLIPTALWTPVLTNPFNAQGVLTYTNTYNPSLPQQYFRFLFP